MERDALHTIPKALREVFTITEVDDAGFLAGELFRRKYGTAPPDVGRHLVALYKDPVSGAARVAGYSHMRRFDEVYLSGGSCTDGDTIRAMPPDERRLLTEAGGVLHQILMYAFARYADCCVAFFGHCGDRRALEVVTRAGFVSAGHEHLIVHWHKPLQESVRRALVARVHALGPF